MRIIKLSQGKVALVDDEDFWWLNSFSWHLHSKKKLYASRMGPTVSGKQQCVLMHRIILNAPVGIEVDHKNGNKLDNRKKNLRLSSRLQNAANRLKNKNGSSRFKGVWWNKKLKRWQAGIAVNHVSKHLGLFASETKAARAYNVAAQKYFGKFASLNFL